MQKKITKQCPCNQHCPDRAELTRLHGSCHNEHCPNGWTKYENRYFEEDVKNKEKWLAESDYHEYREYSFRLGRQKI